MIKTAIGNVIPLRQEIRERGESPGQDIVSLGGLEAVVIAPTNGTQVRKSFGRPSYVPEHPLIPNIISKSGYKDIGNNEVGYDQKSIDVQTPKGKNRGVMFVPADGRFDVTFFEIPKGLYGTYPSLADALAHDEFRAYRTYTIPDGMGMLTGPLPKIYDAHDRLRKP